MNCNCLTPNKRFNSSFAQPMHTKECKAYHKGIEDGKKQHAGMYRQLFREMADSEIFTAKRLADMFEKECPLDPNGLMDKMADNLRINAIEHNLKNNENKH